MAADWLTYEASILAQTAPLKRGGLRQTLHRCVIVLIFVSIPRLPGARNSRLWLGDTTKPGMIGEPVLPIR